MDAAAEEIVDAVVTAEVIVAVEAVDAVVAVVVAVEVVEVNIR